MCRFLFKITVQAFAWWIGGGCAAYLNICQGQENSQNAHKAIGTGLLFTVAISLLNFITFEQAKKNVRRSDGARSAYYDNIPGQKLGVANAYNLCIDSSAGIETSAELILKYIRGNFSDDKK